MNSQTNDWSVVFAGVKTRILSFSTSEYSDSPSQPLKWQVAGPYSQSKSFPIVLYSYKLSQYKEI